MGGPLKRYVIEREMPGIRSAERQQFREAAQKSNEVLAQLAPDVQWVESYVTDNKIFCVYMANDEAVVRKHADMAGFPADKTTEVKRVIDPTTAQQPNSAGLMRCAGRDQRQLSSAENRG